MSRASLQMRGLILAAFSAIPTLAHAADPVILTDAVPTIQLSPSGVGGTIVGLTFHPRLRRYFGSTGGSTNAAGFTWLENGAFADTIAPLNADPRAINYNPATDNLEIVTFSARVGGSLRGLVRMPITAGVFGNAPTTILAALPGLPGDQTAPAFDPARNRFYAKSVTDSVSIVSRVDGTLQGTIVLDYSTLGSVFIQPQSIGYDPAFDVLVTVDTLGNRAIVHRLNGTLVGTCSLPNVSPGINLLQVSYTNGQLFLFDQPAGVWRGFEIFQRVMANTSARQYLLIATPVNPPDPSVSTLLVPQLGSPDTMSWRLGHFLPDQNAYAMAGPFYASIGRELVNMIPGEGYWVITNSPKTLRISGQPVTGIALFLSPGPAGPVAFNQLGNPLTTPANVSNITVHSLGGPSFSLTDPANTYTDHVIWTWNGANYVSLGSGGSLPVASGFWLRRTTAGLVALTFDAPTSMATRDRSVSAEPGSLWQMSLEARQGDLVATPIQVGAASVENGKWNPLSHALPPNPPGGNFLRLVIPKSDWGEMNGEYASEYAPEADRMTWNVNLSGGEVPGQVELKLVGDLPSGSRAELMDVSSGDTWRLAPGAPLSLAARASGRQLRLVVTREAPTDVASTPGVALRAYPNPFEGSIGLVAQGGQGMRVEIFDASGRRLRTLSHAGGTGESVLVWDGRDESGTAVGPGLYFARYESGGKLGTTRLVKMH